MGAIALHLLQPNSDILQNQLNMCPNVTGRLQAELKNYLISRGIYSLDDVTLEDITLYRDELYANVNLSDRQVKYYANLLERVTLAWRINDNGRLKEQIEQLRVDDAIKNRALLFLILMGIRDANEIDYDIRCVYEEHLSTAVVPTKQGEYVKALDLLKLYAICEENIKNPMREHALKYQDSKVFLLYHPSYEMAMTFYYIQNKEELVFDFSQDASGTIKRQFFKMLNHVLETKENWHDRRERFLMPLKLLFQFCVEREIEDIEQLTDKQIEAFRESMDGKVGTKTEVYMQIVDNIRKYLFLSAKNTNWEANAWYLSRFYLEEGRTNPAREIKRFTFGGIETEENRELFKAYMKYQIGVSQKLSIQTLRGIYYGIYDYLRYLDENKLMVNNVTGVELEAYIKELDRKENQATTYNKAVISVARFYEYLVLKKKVLKVPVCFEYYLKRTMIKHNDRAVNIDIQIEILKALGSAPQHQRLMFLNLWCIGLRINEVCAIKGGSYFFDGQNAWIHIYQNKMKTEKQVPIPRILYELMSDYIAKNGIRPDEYVFKNKRGGAYCAGTFSKQFKKFVKGAGVEGYDFKSHDFRHTIASMFYLDGVSIEVIRDYMGHKDNSMTRQYLDYVQDVLDAENANYFSSKEWLGKGI